MIQCTVQNLFGKTAERSEDDHHVSVFFSVIGRIVVTTERGDGEWVILEKRNTRHAEVDVLAGLPTNSSWYCDLDCVVFQYGHRSLLAYAPRDLEWIGPVEIQKPENIGCEPYRSGRPQIVPRGQVIMTMPEEES